MQKEIRVELVVTPDGSVATDVIIQDFEKRILRLKDDFRNIVTEFNFSENVTNTYEPIEIVCPLCKGTIPQLIYKKASGETEGEMCNV